MSVVAVSKMWSKRGGSLDSEKSDAFDVKFAFTDGYQVLTDDTAMDAVDVVTGAVALGLPYFGDQYKSGINAFVTGVKPDCTGPISWMISIGYTGVSDDDANATVEVEWTDTTTTEPIDRDWTGRAIVTVNKEQVDGLSMDIADQVCVIRRKFLTINTAGIAAYRRATNSDTFLGWPAGTARLVGFSAKNQFKYGAPQELWDVTARIQFREPYANTTPAQAWYKRWRHEGLLEKRGGIIQRALDDKLQEVTRPVLLKASGEKETDPDSAVFFHTQVYGSLPFSALGLT